MRKAYEPGPLATGRCEVDEEKECEDDAPDADRGRERGDAASGEGGGAGDGAKRGGEHLGAWFIYNWCVWGLKEAKI